MQELSNLRYYRLLLKAARFYPSVKNKEIYHEIKNLFRENQKLTNLKEIETERKKCKMGLMHLDLYNEKSNELKTSYTTTPTRYETINPKDENFIYF